MGFKAQLVGIQGPGGIVPRETLVYFATQVPIVRDEVIKALVAQGHLRAAGLERVPWYVRWFRRDKPALPAKAAG